MTAGDYTVTLSGTNFPAVVYEVGYAENPSDALHKAITMREEDLGDPQ
jgi:hypothetical protein